MLGSDDAARAVARLIARGAVQGSALAAALSAAARLRATLPVDALRPLLRHADPQVRSGACRCARTAPQLVSPIVDLLDDLDRGVARAAACALGQMGRIEARRVLAKLLREEPSVEVIESVAPIADEECMILLGRIARALPRLADATRDALESIDHPRADAIAASVQRQPPA
jgi:HEAT repeat protein